MASVINGLSDITLSNYSITFFAYLHTYLLTYLRNILLIYSILEINISLEIRLI